MEYAAIAPLAGRVAQSIARVIVGKEKEIELTLAALMAEGTTEIGGVGYILRGYERFDEKLRSIGASVEKITVSDG